MATKKTLFGLLSLTLIFLIAGCYSVTSDSSVYEDGRFPPQPQAPLPLSLEPKTNSNPFENVAGVSTSTAVATPVILTPITPTVLDTATTVSPPTPSPTTTTSPCTSPGQVIQGTYPSQVAGISAYRAYLPPCYDDQGPGYPTLYMLPGNIYTDEVWDRLGIDEAAEQAIVSGQIAPLIIVMADSGYLLNSTSGGDRSYETQIVEDLIPFIDREYCTWAEQRGRAIGGMSRGGYWALEIAFRHPQIFASVGGHSASLLDLYGGPDIIPQSTGLANDLGQLRIYFDIGEDDWVINNIERLHEDMEIAEIEHVWVLNEGRHEELYWASHIEEYLRWYAQPWPLNRKAYPKCLLKLANESE